MAKTWPWRRGFLRRVVRVSVANGGRVREDAEKGRVENECGRARCVVPGWVVCRREKGESQIVEGKRSESKSPLRTSGEEGEEGERLRRVVEALEEEKRVEARRTLESEFDKGSDLLQPDISTREEHLQPPFPCSYSQHTSTNDPHTSEHADPASKRR